MYIPNSFIRAQRSYKYTHAVVRKEFFTRSVILRFAWTVLSVKRTPIQRPKLQDSKLRHNLSHPLPESDFPLAYP